MPMWQAHLVLHELWERDIPAVRQRGPHVAHDLDGPGADGPDLRDGARADAGRSRDRGDHGLPARPPERRDRLRARGQNGLKRSSSGANGQSGRSARSTSSDTPSATGDVGDEIEREVVDVEVPRRGGVDHLTADRVDVLDGQAACRRRPTSHTGVSTERATAAITCEPTGAITRRVLGSRRLDDDDVGQVRRPCQRLGRDRFAGDRRTVRAAA